MEAAADVQGLAVLLTSGQRALRDLAALREDPSRRARGALSVEALLARFSLLEPVLQAPSQRLFL